MSKTNYLQAVISDLQRTAGPYRCAMSGRKQVQQCWCRRANLLDHLVGAGERGRRARRGRAPWQRRELDGFESVNAIRHRGSCRCRLVPRLGVGMLNNSAPAKRGEIEDGTKKAFLTSDARMELRPRERAFGPCSRYTLAYVEPRLSRPDAAPTPADEGRGDPAHCGRRGQLYCRITGRSASEPLGPRCSTPPGYGGPIRDQPPARTRPVLRSAAQSQNAATLKTSRSSPAHCRSRMAAFSAPSTASAST